MDAYGMQQELALEISSTFWKTALGTQAPAMAGQEKNEKPAKKPSEKQPGAQRIKGLLKLFGKMSGFAWLMFVVGAYGVIACTIWLVQAMITEEHADAMGILYLMVGIYLLDLTLKVFWMPLSVVETSDILSRVFSRRALAVLEFFYDNCLEFVFFGPGKVFLYFWFMCTANGLCCPSPVILMVEMSSTPTLAVIGVFACWLYNIVWFVRWVKSKKKNGPMWQ